MNDGCHNETAISDCCAWAATHAQACRCGPLAASSCVLTLCVERQAGTDTVRRTRARCQEAANAALEAEEGGRRTFRWRLARLLRRGSASVGGSVAGACPAFVTTHSARCGSPASCVRFAWHEERARVARHEERPAARFAAARASAPASLQTLRIPVADLEAVADAPSARRMAQACRSDAPQRSVMIRRMDMIR